MIDLYTFLLIKPNLLNILISKLGANLIIESELYTLTLLIANIFAIIIIKLTFDIAMYIYRTLLSRNFRRF